MSDHAASALGWLSNELAIRLGQVMESMIGEKRRVLHAPATAAELAEVGQSEALWWAQPIDGIPGSLILTAAGKQAWFGIGKEILEAAGVEAEAEDAASTFTETLVQSYSGLCQAISIKLRREVAIAAGAKSHPDPSGEWVAFTIGEHNPILIRFSDPLLGLLQPPVLPDSAEHVNRLALPAQAAGATKTLDLLYDVELPVSVSFGRAELPLKDVLKLTSGSIVELNRSVTEPVEIIVNNCVIARGEVVVIEGNYGVRVTQVISRQERLRTLR